MLLSPGQQLFGVNAQLLRAVARELPQDFTLDRACVEFGAPASQVRPVLEALAANGWLQELPRETRGRPAVFDAKHGTRRWQGLCDWNRLRLARIGKPLARERAQGLVQQLVSHVRAANRAAAPDNLVLITQLSVFGSYLNPMRAELGDLDIAVASQDRTDAQARLVDWSDRQQAVKRTYRALKALAPTYVSVHTLESVRHLNTPVESLYRAEDDVGLWLDDDGIVQGHPKLFIKVARGWVDNLQTQPDAVREALKSKELERKLRLAAAAVGVAMPG